MHGLITMSSLIIFTVSFTRKSNWPSSIRINSLNAFPSFWENYSRNNEWYETNCGLFANYGRIQYSRSAPSFSLSSSSSKKVKPVLLVWPTYLLFLLLSSHEKIIIAHFCCMVATHKLFHAHATQQIALHAHEKIAPWSLTFIEFYNLHPSGKH